MDSTLIVVIIVGFIFIFGLSFGIYFDIKGWKKTDEILLKYTRLLKDVYNIETLEKIDVALRAEATKECCGRTQITIKNPKAVNIMLLEIAQKIKTILMIEQQKNNA